MRVRRHTAALIITSALFAAGVVAPADAKPGNGNANGHSKGHCRAFHASGVGVDDGTGTTDRHHLSRQPRDRYHGRHVRSTTVERTARRVHRHHRLHQRRAAP